MHKIALGLLLGLRAGAIIAQNFSILTAKQISTTSSGRHSDGGKLYLVVSDSGARRWAFKYRAPNRKQREMDHSLLPPI